eukprot:1394891-Pleurochrysis_carterae.AAC.1
MLCITQVAVRRESTTSTLNRATHLLAFVCEESIDGTLEVGYCTRPTFALNGTGASNGRHKWGGRVSPSSSLPRGRRICAGQARPANGEMDEIEALKNK